jgi:predicted transcriptional regulator of viral defense system
MKYFELNKINKLYFGHEDIARILGISLASAKVSAYRYIRQGFLVRLKRNMYVLREIWLNINREQQFSLANMIQSPSYISLMTALDYYGVTTQIQRNYIESIALLRTKEISITNTVFNYTIISAALYSEFIKEKDFYIAVPEKAFIDAVYLLSLGRYSFDTDSLDLGKLNPAILNRIRDRYPVKMQRLLEKYDYS